MKKATVYLLGLLTALALTACGGRREWHRAEGAVWATTYHITYEASADLNDSIQAVMRRVELSLSPFNPNSAISKINDNRSDLTDAMIDSVMAISQQVSRISGGRFDPTVSPLVNLWGFGYTGHPADGRAPEPSQEQIDSALSLVGIAGCRIAGGRMVKKAPATTFNFSAVTKGFGCDMVAAMLQRNGCRNYMVEIGGEIAVSGSNPRGKVWRVQVDAPVPGETPGADAMQVIEITDCGIATSGNYRNYLTDPAGRRLGHTISPSTGRPCQTEIVSATVIAPTCGLADALATACMASTLTQTRETLSAIPGVRAILATPAPSNPDSLQVFPVNFP